MTAALIKKREEVNDLSAKLKAKIEKAKKNEQSQDTENLMKAVNDLSKKVDDLAKAKPRKGEDPEIQPEENASMDALLKSRSDKPEIVEFQKNCDALLVMQAIQKAKNPQACSYYSRFQKNTTELKKAMNAATAGSGGNWVPTDFSSRLYRQVELMARVSALFDMVPMSTSTMKLPINTAGLTLYKQAEAQSDSASKIPASTPTVSNLTLTAQKLALRALLSSEIQEDSIIDVIDFIMDRIARAISAGWDNVLLNSDTAGTHMDSDVTSAIDVRKTFLGIRAIAVDGSDGAAIAGSTIAESDLRIRRKAMGVYGVDPALLAIITGPTGYLSMLQNFTSVQTRDKYGDKATIFNGELMKFDGIPVIVSDQYRENLNASGVYDGVTTTKTSVAMVYRPAIVQGQVRGITIKTQEDIETDQIVTVMTTRRALIDLYDEAAGQAFCQHLYNVA